MGKRKAPATLKSYRHHADRHIIPTIGSLEIAAVTPRHVDQLLDQFSDTPAAATQAVRVLSAGYATWKRWQWLPEGFENPCNGAEPYKPKPRRRIASEAELDAFWLEIDRYRATGTGATRDAADILALIALTGARKGLFTRLTWGEVDLQNGIVVVEDASGRKGTERVLLPAAAVEIIGAVKMGGAAVFPGAWKVRRLWERIRSDIGADDLTIHDLRRTWSTLLGEAGIEAEDAAAVLGQRTVTVHRNHYRQLRDGRLRQIAELGADMMKGRG